MAGSSLAERLLGQLNSGLDIKHPLRLRCRDLSTVRTLHRDVLQVSTSDYLRQLLTSHSNPESVIYVCATSSALDCIIGYIYGNSLDSVQTKDLIDVATTAALFELDDLVESCMTFFSDNAEDCLAADDFLVDQPFEAVERFVKLLPPSVETATQLKLFGRIHRWAAQNTSMDSLSAVSLSCSTEASVGSVDDAGDSSSLESSEMSLFISTPEPEGGAMTLDKHATEEVDTISPNPPHTDIAIFPELKEVVSPTANLVTESRTLDQETPDVFDVCITSPRNSSPASSADVSTTADLAKEIDLDIRTSSRRNFFGEIEGDQDPSTAQRFQFPLLLSSDGLFGMQVGRTIELATPQLLRDFLAAAFDAVQNFTVTPDEIFMSYERRIDIFDLISGRYRTCILPQRCLWLTTNNGRVYALAGHSIYEIGCREWRELCQVSYSVEHFAVLLHDRGTLTCCVSLERGIVLMSYDADGNICMEELIGAGYSLIGVYGSYVFGWSASGEMVALLDDQIVWSHRFSGRLIGRVSCGPYVYLHFEDHIKVICSRTLSIMTIPSTWRAQFWQYISDTSHRAEHLARRTNGPEVAGSNPGVYHISTSPV